MKRAVNRKQQMVTSGDISLVKLDHDCSTVQGHSGAVQQSENEKKEEQFI